jgi:SAM-dependent methyltransferase
MAAGRRHTPDGLSRLCRTDLRFPRRALSARAQSARAPLRRAITIATPPPFSGSAAGQPADRSTASCGEGAGRADAGAPRAVVLDLGCGVGGTVRALARRFPGLACHGVTISERQASLARQWNADAGLADRCEIVAADFQSARLDVEADFVIAIESHVHSRSMRRFFDTVVAHLRPGGRLFLIDDFVQNDSGVAAEALADRFRAGWRAPAFGTVAQCARDAGAAGLELAADRDLSPLIRLDRPRDRAIALVAPVIGWLGLGRLPALGSLIGGAALNRGLRDQVFGYHWLEFGRPAA